jgi:hypothetical protein
MRFFLFLAAGSLLVLSSSFAAAQKRPAPFRSGGQDEMPEPAAGERVIPFPGTGAPPLTGSLGRFITPRDFGCVGNGRTDDTACLQAAVDAAAAQGWPLRLDGVHKYLISSTIHSAGAPIIIGATPPLSPYTTACPAGIIVNRDITALSLTGPTAIVRNVCFQMAAAAGTRRRGAAIAVGATTKTQQGHATIAGNTILYPYQGIVVGGATTGATQTNGDVIADNVVIDPSHVGISNGADSTGASTNGTTIRDNQIVCYKAHRAAIGFALYDGSIMYYGGDGGPYNCDLGTAIVPATGQTALGAFMGVVGDSSLRHDLLIAPRGTGTAEYLDFVNAWASNSPQPVYCNARGATAKTISFVGSRFHSDNGLAPIMDLAGCSNVVISGNQIVADGGGTTVGPGIAIGASSGAVTISGNFIGAHFGRLTRGIIIHRGATAITVVGNTIIARTPFTNDSRAASIDVMGNLGIGDAVINGVPGAACKGPPTTSFATTEGIVTHC